MSCTMSSMHPKCLRVSKHQNCPFFLHLVWVFELINGKPSVCWPGTLVCMCVCGCSLVSLWFSSCSLSLSRLANSWTSPYQLQLLQRALLFLLWGTRRPPPAFLWGNWDTQTQDPSHEVERRGAWSGNRERWRNGWRGDGKRISNVATRRDPWTRENVLKMISDFLFYIWVYIQCVLTDLFKISSGLCSHIKLLISEVMPII